MVNKNKILIIEDEKSIIDIMYYSLRKEGMEVVYGLNGREGMALVESFKPDLIILDLMLPDIDGFEICKIITVKYKIPILMVTARDDIMDKVLGLEMGADDYITKPFNIREVVARVKVALRRIENFNNNYIEKYQEKDIIVSENIVIIPKSRIVKKNGEEIKLKPREYDLLLLFSENKGRVFSRETLLDSVWTMDYDGDIRTVDVHVQRLRKKLDDKNNLSIIETIFGVGYKMR
ncbi:response regulator transcription factor [Clostridium sp. Marseille-QA1073]